MTGNNRIFSPSSIAKLARILAERGLSEEEIERGLNYALAKGFRTMRDGYELAMSRVANSDADLAAGAKLTAD